MPGLNTEVEHARETYHVQTQDLGPGANYVETTVYKAGRVLSSRRAYYTSFLSSSDLPDKIHEIIREEHESVTREIEEGKLAHL
jgi:hypothetical protein